MDNINSMLTYRWLDDREIETLVNPRLEALGMVQLNINPAQPTCRVLGAEVDGVIVEAFAFQLISLLGPMIKLVPEFRDNGQTGRAMAEKMKEFLEEVKARAYLCIADSPVSERLCERFGMEKISSPVYAFIRREGG